jgi:hypothetical protein
LPSSIPLVAAVRSWLSLALGTAAILLVACQAPGARALSVGQMTVNGRANPLGIAADDISLAWTIAAEERGTVQGAYQIRVGTTAVGDDVWNSGRMASDRQIDVTLPGDLHLQPATRYFWQVKIWDGNGVESKWSAPAWFETGLALACRLVGRKVDRLPDDQCGGTAPAVARRGLPHQEGEAAHASMPRRTAFTSSQSMAKKSATSFSRPAGLTTTSAFNRRPTM